MINIPISLLFRSAVPPQLGSFWILSTSTNQASYYGGANSGSIIKVKLSFALKCIIYTCVACILYMCMLYVLYIYD